MAPLVSFEVSWAGDDAPTSASGRYAKPGWGPLASATAAEVAPLLRKMGESAEWLENAEETDPARALSWCCEELRPRTIRSFHVLGWLVLQVGSLFFQANLLSEIHQHLSEFEGLLAEHCAPQHLGLGGFCLGPTWTVAASSVLQFPPSNGDVDGADFDFVVPSTKSFGPFSTGSNPPTFLLAVEPLAPASDVKWTALVRPAASGVPPLNEVSGAGAQFRVLSGADRRGVTSWAGAVSLKSPTTAMVEIRVSVVDSRIQHLDVIHKQDQCSFEKSWENFSARHNGSHHAVLSYTASAMKACLVVSTVLIAALLYRHLSGGGMAGLLRRAIVFKCFAQDFPQQVCIVAYLYGWYARSGMRCQMCLFRPEHCDEQSPLHTANFVACVFTAASALSTQVLVKTRARTSSHPDEDDEFCAMFLRLAMASVSVLPFSTAVYLSPFSFNLAHFIFLLFLAAVPCMLGWATLLCGWMLVFFADELGL